MLINSNKIENKCLSPGYYSNMCRYLLHLLLCLNDISGSKFLNRTENHSLDRLVTFFHTFFWMLSFELFIICCSLTQINFFSLKTKMKVLLRLTFFWYSKWLSMDHILFWAWKWKHSESVQLLFSFVSIIKEYFIFSTIQQQQQTHHVNTKCNENFLQINSKIKGVFRERTSPTILSDWLNVWGANKSLQVRACYGFCTSAIAFSFFMLLKNFEWKQTHKCSSLATNDSIWVASAEASLMIVICSKWNNWTRCSMAWARPSENLNCVHPLVYIANIFEKLLKTKSSVVTRVN